jgi:hypothetical protein
MFIPISLLGNQPHNDYRIYEVNKTTGEERISFDSGKKWHKYKRMNRILEIRKDGKYQSFDRGRTWTKLLSTRNIETNNLLKVHYVNNNIYIDAEYENSYTQPGVLTIYNLIGSRIFEIDVKLQNGRNVINVDDNLFVTGLHFMCILTDNGFFQMNKVILQK